MKRKIICMGIISIFLLMGLLNASGMDISQDAIEEQFSSIDIDEKKGIDVYSAEITDVSWNLLTHGFGNENNFATRGIGIYRDELYIGTQSYDSSVRVTLRDVIDFFKLGGTLSEFMNVRYSQKSSGCEVWKYNATTLEFTQVVGDLPEAQLGAGFGDKLNSAAAFCIEFKGKLYIGTMHTSVHGGQLWSYDGSDWVNEVADGFGDSSNYGLWTAVIFNDYLYIGTANFRGDHSGYTQIWRSYDGSNWEKVVDRGFRDFDVSEGSRNRYAWSMQVYQDELYVGTYNNPTSVIHGEIWTLDVFKRMFNKIFKNEKEPVFSRGCQLWKTSDGDNWEKVEIPHGDGFGKIMNYGIRNMVEYDEWLYVATAGMFKGLEIWKYNGDIWIPVISDKVPGIKNDNIRYNGFGKRDNQYAMSMRVTSDNNLWVGTVNVNGFELYRFNGLNWIQIIGDKENSEMPNGLGVSSNYVARSLIEYPKDSGNLFLGTSTSFAIPSACQFWTREIN